ncbi:host specificity protein J [Salmonella enterica subsp. enterica]|nr:host specificity protein J [Salmonella enterica subsp. enterica serovar Poona]ECW2669609.1 host specificity protein J [Salmonella enterica]EBU7356926.1 host specificity protein J [Salmonella enterica subsp. enterica serovar Poona]ECA2557808.1 host specificity protein J [Salmonella enterica subsp. enterica serovar Poona]ECD3887501.1 host specificity protein J [Salmonella enterica subsp. enterica serovar Poona]
MAKGQKKQHTPREERDNLKSVQELSVIDVIGEGPIEGPVNGLQSLLLNDTPVLDPQGEVNIHGVEAEWRAGEDDQSPLTGFDGSAAETLIQAEVKYDKPITRTITSEVVDRLRVTIGVQALQRTTDKGDRLGSSVQMDIQIQRNGSWLTAKSVIINGKRTSAFMTAIIIDNLPPRPFNIRVVRINEDSTTDMLQNKTVWQGLTEIINLTQSYPNTALVGLKVDADQFGSQSVSRKFHCLGRIVLVPSNYDPKSRTYAGLWDGTFKPAYTNNPAWIILDLLTHPRYGLGQRIGLADVDKWTLYAISQYCDQMVPDGFGGQEPRMTCNVYLTDRRKAYDVISDFCSVMRCMPVWTGQRMTFIQDRPSDTVWTYTNANVVNGEFNYSYSAAKDRHNAAEIRFIDPQNGWNVSVELVEDKADIAKNGRKVLQMDAFGCTSRGQAHRTGLWVIQTELLETQMVTFGIGAEGLRHTPGDIFEVCDSDYAGASIGGRIVAVDEVARSLTLDRDIELPGTGNTTISFIGHDGKPLSESVVSQPDKNSVVLSSLPAGVAVGSVWGLKLPTLRRRLFRCMAIQEKEDGTFAVSALQHVPEKEAIVDRGATFEPESGTLNGVTPPAVQHLAVDTSADSSLYQAKATWDTPRVIKGVRFVLRLTVGAGTEEEPARLVTTATTSETEYAFHELPLGDYTLTVRAINGYGQQGEPASVAFSIQAPEAPSTIELTPGYFQITVTPHQTVYDASVQYEFWYSATQLTIATEIQSKAQYLGTGSFWIKGNIKPAHDAWFYVRSVNLVGKSTFAEARGQSSDDAEGLLEILGGKITDTELDKELLEKIDSGGGANAKIEEVSKSWTDAEGKLNALRMAKIGVLQDGRYYLAGIGMGIENTPDGMQSQILMAAQQLAIVDPTNGNTIPMFVARGGQIIMNEAFTKSLNVNGRFIVTPDGEVTIRTYPGRNVGQVITSRKTTVYDEQGRPRFESGELD